jgi:hypothetical protein
MAVQTSRPHSKTPSRPHSKTPSRPHSKTPMPTIAKPMPAKPMRTYIPPFKETWEDDVPKEFWDGFKPKPNSSDDNDKKGGRRRRSKSQKRNRKQRRRTRRH